MNSLTVTFLKRSTRLVRVGLVPDNFAAICDNTCDLRSSHSRFAPVSTNAGFAEGGDHASHSFQTMLRALFCLSHADYSPAPPSFPCQFVKRKLSTMFMEMFAWRSHLQLLTYQQYRHRQEHSQRTGPEPSRLLDKVPTNPIGDIARLGETNDGDQFLTRIRRVQGQAQPVPAWAAG